MSEAVSTTGAPVDVVTISTNCGACGVPLKDDLDARAGLDRSCRAQFNYRHISALSDDERREANWAIHAIAQGSIRWGNLRNAIFRLYELGFTDLSKRIERRVGRATVPEETRVEVQPTTEQIAQAEAAVVPIDNVRPLPFDPTADQDRALTVIRDIKRLEGYAVAVIVGYAGVGKTSLIQFIAHEHGSPLVVTPTGKAALRVREATGVYAMTIHRWIYAPAEDPKTGAVTFQRRTAEEIEALIPRSRMVVLDESSMVGPDVWQDVRTVCEHHGLKLVCIGDGFQLPPVQPSKAAPFSILVPDFAAQLNAPRVEMTEVLRQAAGSPIIRASMALRQGQGWNALRGLQQIQQNQLAQVCLAVHQQGGVTICHRNMTRFSLNAGIRHMLGIYDEMPRPGEPLMVLKNSYEIGVVNGEQVAFPGWEVAPDDPERVYDRWSNVEETARFGGIMLQREDAGNKVLRATVAIEELHGRLTAGQKAIAISGNRWARLNGLYTAGDALAPHMHVNFGYTYTAHKSQGSQWRFVLVVLEPTIRLETEEGRRWLYTAVTRAQEMVAIFQGTP